LNRTKIIQKLRKKAKAVVIDLSLLFPTISAFYWTVKDINRLPFEKPLWIMVFLAFGVLYTLLREIAYLKLRG